MDDFNLKGAAFWGALAAFFGLVKALFIYLTSKIKEKVMTETNEKVGIKETKELLEGLNAVGMEVVKVAKDGLQVKDAATLVEDLVMNPEFKAKLQAAIENVGQVPAEIKDIDLSEGVELIKFEYDGVKQVLSALQG